MVHFFENFPHLCRLQYKPKSQLLTLPHADEGAVLEKGFIYFYENSVALTYIGKMSTPSHLTTEDKIAVWPKKE